jgi:hypothetical protein
MFGEYSAKEINNEVKKMKKDNDGYNRQCKNDFKGAGKGMGRKARKRGGKNLLDI